MDNFKYEGYIHIDLDEDIVSKFHYAEILASKLEHASANPTYTHETKGLAGALRENIAILKGDVPKRKDTSLGNIEFFLVQIKMAESRLEKIAKDIFDRRL